MTSLETDYLDDNPVTHYGLLKIDHNGKDSTLPIHFTLTSSSLYSTLYAKVSMAKGEVIPVALKPIKIILI